MTLDTEVKPQSLMRELLGDLSNGFVYAFIVVIERERILYSLITAYHAAQEESCEARPTA